MSQKSKWEYFKAIYQRYHKATPSAKRQILNEFCQTCAYNRKYAISKLNGPPPEKLPPKRRKRSPTYSSQTILILSR